MPCSLWNRSEEHTSELQSSCNLVCRLLLEKIIRTIRLCTHQYCAESGCGRFSDEFGLLGHGCQPARVQFRHGRLEDQPAYRLFFFNDRPTPESYPFSLHDALPI